MSQSSLNWDILNTVQGRRCHIVFPKTAQNCSALSKLARQKCSKLARKNCWNCSKVCSKLLKTAQTCSNLLKLAQNCSNLLKIAQICSKLLKMRQNVSKCFNMDQQVFKGVMCLHMQVRKLSLLGISVAGVYCCMGLRSVSIVPRSSLLLRSDPSIVNFNWQGSLVIRLAAIVSINGLSRKIIIALIGKTFHAHSFICFITASWWYHNQIWTSVFCIFWSWKVSDLNLTDVHPKLRTVN